MAGTDGPGGQVTPAPMVRGTINFIPDMGGRGGGGTVCSSMTA